MHQKRGQRFWREPTTVATIDDQPTLAVPTDERDEPAQISLFGPAGQLVLPGARPAQLSLDGAAYSPLSPSPDRASRSLGNPHGLSHERPDDPPVDDEDFEARLRHQLAPLGVQLQLALDEEAFAGAPQLDMWRRLDVAHDMLRGGEFDRDAKCRRVRFTKDAEIAGQRTDGGLYTLGAGQVHCGKYTCPACGPERARDVSARIAIGIGRHLKAAPETDVAMLSLTIPHGAAEDPEDLIGRLFAASADLWREKEWRAFEKRLGVSGRVRAFDVVFGGTNGLHAHFHVLLFIDRALIGTTAALSQLVGGVDTSLSDFADPRKWTVRDTSSVPSDAGELVRQLVPTDLAGLGPWTPIKGCDKQTRTKWYRDQEAPLFEAWSRCLRRHGVSIKDPAAFRRVGLRLSPSEKAANYFLKWGLWNEIGSVTSKDRNHLRLLDAVAAGVKGAAYTWKQFRRAIDGHTWITGVADMCKRLAITDLDVAIFQADLRVRRERESVRVKFAPLAFVIRSHLYAAAVRLGWPAVFAEIDRIDDAIAHGSGGDLQTELDTFLWRHLHLVTSRDTS